MLIVPKLHIPQVRAKMLPRKHLLERLTQGKQNRLISISGPAGSGKTSLACQWLSEIQPQSAWYSLDDGDNDPDVFFRYFFTALGMADRRLASDLEPWVQGNNPLIGHDILPGLSGYLSRCLHDVYIVLDDYHCIASAEIHDVIRQLLSLTLPKIHFVILSRHALPFSIARMKVRDQVLEIPAEEMKISYEETKAFFTEIMPVSLSPAQLKRLARHMEGWLGGLQLFGVSLHGKASHAVVDDVLNRTYREAADYLIDEVLDAQPEDIRAFLQTTTLLHRFNAELGELVSHLPDAERILIQVYDNNLFLTCQDLDQEWYSYHPLFARAVRQRYLQDVMPQYREICRKAALWFAATGYPEDAFRQAFALDDMEFAADLLEDIFVNISEQFQMAYSHGWLAKLPLETFKRRPLLRLQDCRIKLQLVELSDVAEILDDIEAHWDDTGRYHGVKKRWCDEHLFLLRRILPFWFDPENVDTYSLESALQQISPETKVLSSFHTVLPFSHYFKGDLLSSAKSLKQIQNTILSSGNKIAVMIWFRVAATVEMRRGNLHGAEEIIHQAFQLPDNHGLANIPLRFMVDLPMAWICYQRNELDKTLAYADSVLSYAEQTRFFYEIADVNYLLSLVHAAGGHSRKADRCMQRMRSASDVIATPGMVALADARAARMALRQGNIDAADTWMKTRKLSMKEPFSLRFAFECLVAAEMYFSQGRFQMASEILEHLRVKCVTHQMMETVLAIDVLRAAVHYKLSEFRHAQKVMRGALIFARAQEYVRPFVDHIQWISPVLAMTTIGSGKSEEDSFRKKVSQSGGVDLNIVGMTPADEPVIFCPLTRRELDVLSHMALGYTNQDIAEKCFISLDTVKTHAKHIFEKLNTKTRGQAVRRAQELNIL